MLCLSFVSRNSLWAEVRSLALSDEEIIFSSARCLENNSLSCARPCWERLRHADPRSLQCARNPSSVEEIARSFVVCCSVDVQWDVISTGHVYRRRKTKRRSPVPFCVRRQVTILSRRLKHEQNSPGQARFNHRSVVADSAAPFMLRAFRCHMFMIGDGSLKA
jgi:hypothetical protein